MFFYFSYSFLIFQKGMSENKMVDFTETLAELKSQSLSPSDGIISKGFC